MLNQKVQEVGQVTVFQPEPLNHQCLKREKSNSLNHYYFDFSSDLIHSAIIRASCFGTCGIGGIGVA